jgi:HPt (histidine-containing phosphotransfer) domain-containing protein
MMINEEKFAETYAPFDRETVVEIIDIFLEEYQERIDKLSRQLENKNLPELQKSAHAFRGVIANFETDCRAYDEIAEIETECRNLLMDNAQADTNAIDEVCIKLTPVFLSFKRNSRQLFNQLREIRVNYAD